MQTQWKVRRPGPWSRLGAWLAALSVGAIAHVGCAVQRDDGFVLLRRNPQRAAGEPTPLFHAASDDPAAMRVRRLLSDGFAAELLRTYAMTRRLVQQTAPPGSVRRTRADAPVYVALGISDDDRGWPYRDRLIGGGWLRETIAADVPIVWVEDPTPDALPNALDDLGAERDPAWRDAAVLERIVAGLGQAIVSIAAPPAPAFSSAEPRPYPLRDGYLQFLQVVGAEWRSAGGDGIGSDAHDYLRRAQAFAAVRSNEGLARFRQGRIGDGYPDLSARDSLRMLMRDPLVIATTLYRLASSSAGHRLARDEVYRPFVQAPPPEGISPGRLLGTFRNFQAKLLSAWSSAALARPHDGNDETDLIDLVEAYAAAYPEERAEVIRIFLATTDGLTARPGGVNPYQAPQRVAEGLAALTADVLFGLRDLRTALRPAQTLKKI